MATNFPTSLDTLTNPSATDTLDSPPHDEQHADANDAIEALQAKVGVNSSAVTTSLDYRVGQLETGGGGMTVSSTAPVSPVEGDMWYDDTTGRTYVYYDDGTSQQWVEFGAPPAGIGKILQVVSTTKVNSFSTTSTSLVDITDLSVAITPSSASNKVLVIANSNMAHSSSSGEVLQLVRDSTTLCVSTAGSSLNGTFSSNIFNATNNQSEPIAFSFLDSPATTSATTYKLQVRTSGGTVYVNQNTGGTYASTSTITVMEVSA